MSSRNKSKTRLVINSSPEILGEKSGKSRKKKSISHEFQVLFNKINSIREWTKNLIRDSVALVSTESDMDIKSYLDDSGKEHLGKTKLEILGMDMMEAAKSLGLKGGTYEKALLKVGECERRLGTYGRDLVVDVCSSFIRPLKYFMEVEMNRLLEEKEMLTSRKIDYDYHVKQAANGREDKNAHHKLKMAEMALEFQYVHAKEILQSLEVSECQVGHLCDLVSVQTVYHQKCLDELDKVKSELKRMSSNVPTEKPDVNHATDVLQPPFKMQKKKPEKSRVKTEKGDRSALKDTKTSNLKILTASQQRFQNTNRTKAEKSSIGFNEVVGVDEEGRLVSGGSEISHQNKQFQPENAHLVKCPQKVRSSMPSIVKNNRKLEQSPEGSRSGPNVGSSLECSKHQSKVVPISTRKQTVIQNACHHHSGDHSGGSRKDDYTSDDSTTSKETHVIPIPVRSNYRRDVGKMFFTPCKDLE